MSREEFEVQEASGKVKLAVRKLHHEDYEEAEKIYAIRVSSLVKESVGRRLLVRQTLDTFLKESGIWTDADEKKVGELRDEVDTLLAKLKKGGIKLSEGRTLAIEIYEKRMEIVKIQQKKQVFDDTTIESIAENEKADYFVYACTVYADSGKNYWDSFEDMKNDKLSDAYRKASVKVARQVYGLDTEFEKSLPENKWLKKFGFVDEELSFVDRKTGKKVDKSGNPVENVEEMIQKRIDSIRGDIKEEAPYIDDETNEPVKVEDKVEEEKSEASEPEETEAEVTS